MKRVRFFRTSSGKHSFGQMKEIRELEKNGH